MAAISQATFSNAFGDKPFSEPMMVFWVILTSLGPNELMMQICYDNNKIC